MQQRLDALPPALAHRRLLPGHLPAHDPGRGCTPSTPAGSRTRPGSSAGTWSSPSCSSRPTTPTATAGRPTSRGPGGSRSTPRRPARPAARPGRHQRARQLRPAAGPARRHQRRRLHRPGRAGPPAPRPRAHRRRAVVAGSAPRTPSWPAAAGPARPGPAPLNRLGSKRFLRESRQKVWHNADRAAAGPAAGPGGVRRAAAELEVLSAARIADLLAPGQVLLKLAIAGFGVTLPPPRASD